MPRLHALLLCALLPALGHAEIYQWKDENGRTHFGEDVPAKYRKNAELKTLGPSNVMKASEAAVHPRSGRPSEVAPPETGAEQESEPATDTPPPAPAE